MIIKKEVLLLNWREYDMAGCNLYGTKWLSYNKKKFRYIQFIKSIRIMNRLYMRVPHYYNKIKLYYYIEP